MFKDRYDAAHQLVAQLQNYKDNPDVIILAIPRGGLELGSVLAHDLHAPLDVVFSKKIGAPGNDEFAIGAVGLEGVIIDPYFDVSEYHDYIQQKIVAIRKLLQERYREYMPHRSPLELKDKIVIVTDDGVATGKTMLLTLDLIRKHNPKKLVVALPVCSPEVLDLIQEKADEVICLLAPEQFYAVGQFYQQFQQVSDQEAIALLNEARI